MPIDLSKCPVCPLCSNPVTPLESYYVVEDAKGKQSDAHRDCALELIRQNPDADQR